MKISGDFERMCFEFDRKIVAEVLDALRDTIRKGAIEMEMVADEKMFDSSLSGTLSRTAQHLRQMLNKVEKLVDGVADARGYPEVAIARPFAPAVVRRLPDRT